MKNHKLIIMFVSILLVLFYCIGCNKSNEKSVVSDNNKNIYEHKVTPKEQSNENIDKYEIKPNIIFYVLKDEYFENNDVRNPKSSELISNFICYNGVKNGIYPYTNEALIDKVSNIQEFREKLFLTNSNELKLPQNTIVSSQVLKKWELQGYNGSSSYSDKSPIGLSYYKIQ